MWGKRKQVIGEKLARQMSPTQKMSSGTKSKNTNITVAKNIDRDLDKLT